MAEPIRTDIVLPDGSSATVPEKDLSQALAAGARLPTDAERQGAADEERYGGLLGRGLAAGAGAARTATLGLSDELLRSGADIIGGASARRDMLQELNKSREVNPLSNLAGEAAGLFIGGGEAITGAGEMLEGAVAARAGEGLVGSTLSMGARGGLEASALGAGHAMSETALGDHAYNGEAIWSQAAKDALLGAGAGATFGAGGYYLGRAADGLLAGMRSGPRANSVLDEIAEVGGAGRQLRADAREAEDFIANARKTGLTSEQAAVIHDEIRGLAGQRASAGPASGLVDGLADMYAKAGGDVELAALKARQYATEAGKIAQHEEMLDQLAKKSAEATTKAFRKGTMTADEAQFAMKADTVGKLVDKTRADLQADAVASMLQKVDEFGEFWGATMTKGGAEGAVKNIGKLATDMRSSLVKAIDGGENVSRDMYLRMDAMKRQLDSMSQWNKGSHGLAEAIGSKKMGVFDETQKQTIRELADSFRGVLEDETVWGAQAAGAQREMNAAYSNHLARTNHFSDTMGVSIDQQRGIRLPEGDFAKQRGVLASLRGNEIDESLQSVKSTKEFIAGQRARYDAIEKYADLSAAQKANFVEARAALDELESTFAESRKQASVINRLKAQQLDEQSRGLGGLIGLVGDVMTKPLTTMDRLAQIRNTTAKLEDSIAKGLEKFFGSDGKALAERLAPRAKDVVAKEIEEIRTVSGNPEAMQDRIGKMLGDLPKHAPKIAEQAGLAAQRAMMFLAQEAPRPAVPVGIIAAHNLKGRYSDQQISDWEEKRHAALDPESVVRNLVHGRLNRNAIKAVQFVSPVLFEKIRQMTIDHIQKLESEVKLDNMPYQQKAVISALLNVPADRTWTPEFIAAMQATKASAAPANAKSGPIPQPDTGVMRRAVKFDTSLYSTEASAIEGAAA